MAQAAEDRWDSPFYFGKSDVKVIIRHRNDKMIRVNPQDNSKCDGIGGYGVWAQWTAKIRNEKDELQVQFTSNKTGTQLRITANAEIDAGGKDGPLTWFKVHRESAGVCKLESAKFDGKWIAVDKDSKLVVGKGGPWCRLEILKEGPPPKFVKPYLFKQKNTVVIEHRGHKNINTTADGKIGSNGEKGEWAQFEAMPENGGKSVQFLNKKTGKYLRIMKNGEVDVQGVGGPFCKFEVIEVDSPNEVRLKAEKTGKYLRYLPVKDEFDAADDAGDRRTIFTLYRED
jgi:hypothetical protein